MYAMRNRKIMHHYFAISSKIPVEDNNWTDLPVIRRMSWLNLLKSRKYFLRMFCYLTLTESNFVGVELIPQSKEWSDEWMLKQYIYH